MSLDADALAWDRAGGLLPAVVQDAATLRVLMVGYMDRAALAATRDSGWVTFFSRRRQASWTKGETSGHRLALVDMAADCDGDALLVTATPLGPTCHRGTASCFVGGGASALHALERRIDERLAAGRPEGSYTARLAAAGVRAVAQKVGEEGVETALAAVAQGEAELAGEAADLLYHLLVLLRLRGASLRDVESVLAARGR